MSKQWCTGTLACLLLAGGLSAQQDRDLQLVSSKNNDGSLSSALAGENINLGVYHALLIGINQYQHPEFAPNLSTPMNDVYNVRDLLIRRYGFDNENVKLLLNDQATRAGILHALTLFRDAPLGGSDNLLVYFAGHGYQHPGTEDGFWIPSDATTDESTWVPVSEIRRIVKNIRAKHTLLISDSCFSGTLTRSTVTLPTNDRFVAEVAKKDSYQALTSGGLEPVADGGRDGMSLFAYSLTSYLKNPAHPYFTAAQLYTDVAPIVSNASGSRQTPEEGKIPGTFDDNGQFIFARIDMMGNVPAPPSAPAPPAAPQPTSTLGPVTPPSIPPGTIAFIDIAFAQPQGWLLSQNQPGQKMEYKDPQSGASIELISAYQDNAAAMLNDPPASLKVMTTAFINNFKKQGFKKVELGTTEEKAMGDLHVFTWDVTYSFLSTVGWGRTAVVVDPKTSRTYTFTTFGGLDKKDVANAAVTRIISSLQRASK